MIIDCFTFFQEKIQLLCRLHELNEVVDKFVLVESSFTQSLQPKQFFFDEFKKEKEFSPFLDRIVHVKVDEKFEGSVWSHDIGQRNCITRGLDIISPSSSDVILLSDVDEIPRKELVSSQLNNLQPDSFFTFQLGYYCYYLNLQILDEQKADFRWNGTVAVKPSIFKSYTPHQAIKFRDLVINQTGHPNVIANGGWHISYLSPEVTYNKWFATCEPFRKEDIPPKDQFAEIWKNAARPGGNFIFCDNLSNHSLEIRKIELNTLPKYIQDNQEKYKDLIWTE